MTRPDRLVLVVGTATDIGKTWVGAAALAALRARGVGVSARKPAQSFDPGDQGPLDAETLASATGETAEQVCPTHRSYAAAMAPPMAADALGRDPLTRAELHAELRWPSPPVAVGWLETVGGPRSPIAVDADAVTLAQDLDPDLVVLVADAGLGTVNAVLCSIEPFRSWPVTVMLNRYHAGDDLHRRNRDWLRTREGLDIVTDIEALVERVGGSPR